MLDAALSGGPHDIAAGTLTLWVGGDEVLLDEMRPVLESYASPIMFVGPLGNGQRVKLVNNALFVAQVGLAVDAVRLAGSLGIVEPAILEALQHGSGSSRALGVVARGGSVDTVAGRLGALMRKDLAVVREVARRSGADLGIIGTVLSSDAVESEVLGRNDVMKVGFIGLGSMGLPMAQRIHADGHDLTVWARRPVTLEPFAGSDVTIASTPAAMGSSVEAVCICVFDAAGVGGRPVRGRRPDRNTRPGNGRVGAQHRVAGADPTDRPTSRSSTTSVCSMHR